MNRIWSFLRLFTDDYRVQLGSVVFIGILGFFLDVSLIALFIKAISLAILIYLFKVHLELALGPRDFLSDLRWRIFALICTVILSLTPSIWLQLIVLMGMQPGMLRDIVTVTTNISILSFAILLLSILRYKPVGEEKHGVPNDNQ